MTRVAASLVDDLRRVVALAGDVSGYESDWTGRVRGSALAVALPVTTDEVGAVLRTCAGHGVGVTVRGGGTGLVAGAVPDDTVATLGVTHKLDVSLPLSRLGPFVAALPGVTSRWTTHVFGHVGDGSGSSAGGCTCPARRRRSRRCGRSRPRSTRPACSAPACCCPIRDAEA
jgi:hypothetical protein